MTNPAQAGGGPPFSAWCGPNWLCDFGTAPNTLNLDFTLLVCKQIFTVPSSSDILEFWRKLQMQRKRRAGGSGQR